MRIDSLQIDIARWSVPIRAALPGCPTNRRDGVLVRLAFEECVGLGDCAPLPGFSAESLPAAELALVNICRQLYRRQHDFMANPVEVLEALLVGSPSSVRFALEGAVDALFKPVAAGLGEAMTALPRGRLLVGDNHTIAQQCVALPKAVQVVKVKVGRQSLVDDIALVNTMDRLLPTAIKIRLDGNRCWTVPQGRQFAQNIARQRIQFIEEPMADCSELARFAANSGLPVALDESLQWRFIDSDCAAHICPDPFAGLAALVVKPTLAGGVHRCRRLAQFANQHSLKLVLSSAYESSVGINRLLALAAELAPRTAPGLDTLSAFDQSIVEPPLLPLIPHRSVVPWSQLTPVWSSRD